MLEQVNNVLDFWFGKNEQELTKNQTLWWAKNPDFDQLICQKFTDLHRLAAAGRLDYWLEQPKSCLALIIILDQFSRNIYRNSSLAFTQDKKALSASNYGREHKLDRELSLFERQFFYMPYMHAEDLAYQKLSMRLMKQLVEIAKQDKNLNQHVAKMQAAVKFSQAHLDIIQNFGRFPHRNDVLDRESTQAELLFLSMNNSSF